MVGRSLREVEQMVEMYEILYNATSQVIVFNDLIEYLILQYIKCKKTFLCYQLGGVNCLDFATEM